MAIHRRRWTSFFALPFAIVLLVGGIEFALIAYNNLDGKFGVAVAGLGVFTVLCIDISVGRSSWTALTDKDPVLIVDATGITDRFHFNAILPWNDIKSVSVDYGDGNQLTITLRDGVMKPSGKLVEPSITRTLRRAFTGADLTIPLSSLSYNSNKLRDLLRYYKRS